MAETEKPDLKETIRWARDSYTKLFIRSWSQDRFRCLIGAAEKWLKFTQAHPITASEADALEPLDFYIKHYGRLKADDIKREMLLSVEADKQALERLEPTEKPDREEVSGKPSVTEAIGWAYAMIKAHQKAEDFPASYSRPKINEEKLRRLVEAAEFEKEFCKQAWWWRDRKCPNCPEKDRRIEELQREAVDRKDRGDGYKLDARCLAEEVEQLRSQLAEKEQELVEAKGSESFHYGIGEDLKNQLAELEDELHKKDRRYEKMDEGYSHQIASQDIEIERLEDELYDPRLSTTQGFIKAMELIDEGLTKGKLEIEKVRKVIKIIPEDSPTEAEVEKVAAKLHYQGYSKPSKAPTDWNGCAPTTKLRYRRRARHVIERGYCPEEE